MTTKMIDISSNNHTVGAALPWGALKKAGYGAVMIKATEGTNYVNPYLQGDVAGALAVGFGVGYYHFAHPGVNEAKAEVNHFWQTVKTLPRSLGLALDLEVTEGRAWVGLQVWSRTFLDAIPTEVKQRVLYSNPEFVDHLGTLPADFDLWLASWGKQPRTKVWAWQMGQAQITGMPSPVDVGILY